MNCRIWEHYSPIKAKVGVKIIKICSKDIIPTENIKSLPLEKCT